MLRPVIYAAALAGALALSTNAALARGDGAAAIMVAGAIMARVITEAGIMVDGITADGVGAAAGNTGLAGGG